jgi:hypothetical protein
MNEIAITTPFDVVCRCGVYSAFSNCVSLLLFLMLNDCWDLLTALIIPS